jgi:hypothetical protein
MQKYVYRYRWITIRSTSGENDETFIFKHQFRKGRRGILHPTQYGVLVDRMTDRDAAIRKSEALNILEQLEEE